MNMNPWDRASEFVLHRRDPINGEMCELDRGVNFFVLMLEQLGAATEFSCEGHPSGFFIHFNCSYDLARKIHSVGYFNVFIRQMFATDKDRWSLVFAGDKLSVSGVEALRHVAYVWDSVLGPLDWSNVK